MNDTPVKSYTKKKLAAMYNVSPDTLRAWIRKNKQLTKKMEDYKKARNLPPRIIRAIFEHLGEP